MSELYPVLILKGPGWLLMARFTPHSRADVAQMWPNALFIHESRHAPPAGWVTHYNGGRPVPVWDGAYRSRAREYQRSNVVDTACLLGTKWYPNSYWAVFTMNTD